jgi:hypothetical protein
VSPEALRIQGNHGANLLRHVNCNVKMQWASTVDYSKPWFSQRGGWYCNLCGAYATESYCYQWILAAG